MYIDVHFHAEEDLWELSKTDKKAAAAVTVALQQIQADPDLIDKLTTHGDNLFGATTINVKRWQSLREKRGDLWRFRMLDAAATDYRVVYGYHWQTRQICVLAVVKRELFDYDDHESDIAKRIIADWRDL